MAKTLELMFDGENGSVSISVRNPNESLTSAEIKTAMDELIATNTIQGRNGRIVSSKMARLVERTIEDIEFV
jgi:hypothetical protein